jgi:hypothetical protein
MSLAGSVPKTHPERLGSLLRGAAQLIAIEDELQARQVEG